MRKASTKDLEKRLREVAETLEDGKLLARLTGGDVIAQQFKYHRTCLTARYNKERSNVNNLAKSQGRTEPEPNVYPRVLSELIAYSVESSLHVEEPVIFCLPDICQLYQQRLEQLSVESPHVNSMGLKDSVLAEIPDLEAYRSDKDGREVTLTLLKDVTKVLSS